MKRLLTLLLGVMLGITASLSLYAGSYDDDEGDTEAAMVASDDNMAPEKLDDFYKEQDLKTNKYARKVRSSEDLNRQYRKLRTHAQRNYDRRLRSLSKEINGPSPDLSHIVSLAQRLIADRLQATIAQRERLADMLEAALELETFAGDEAQGILSDLARQARRDIDYEAEIRRLERLAREERLTAAMLEEMQLYSYLLLYYYPFIPAPLWLHVGFIFDTILWRTWYFYPWWYGFYGPSFYAFSGFLYARNPGLFPRVRHRWHHWYRSGPRYVHGRAVAPTTLRRTGQVSGRTRPGTTRAATTTRTVSRTRPATSTRPTSGRLRPTSSRLRPTSTRATSGLSGPSILSTGGSRVRSSSSSSRVRSSSIGRATPRGVSHSSVGRSSRMGGSSMSGSRVGRSFGGRTGGQVSGHGGRHGGRGRR